MVHDTRQSTPGRKTPPHATRLLHDLRNALAGLKLDASLLADDISVDEDDRARIMAYTDGIQQAIALTDRLTTQIGAAGTVPETVDSNEVLEGIVEMANRTLPFSFPVELELEPGVWPVKVDPRPLHRALVLLVTRAQDTMPGGGMLRLASANRTIGRAAAAEIAPDMPRGRYVQLSVGTLCGTTFDGEPTGAEAFDDDSPSSPSAPNPSFDGALEDLRGFTRIHHGPMMTTFELYLPASVARVADLRCLDATEPRRGSGKV